MKKIIVLIGVLVYSSFGYSQQTEVSVSGIVLNGEVPLAGAVIRNSDGSGSTTTDRDGNFKMTARDNDVLEFTHVRMTALEFKLKKGENRIRVLMQPLVANLPEITVESKAKRGQRQLALEYPDNYNIIKSKFGYLNRDRSVYTMRMVEGDKLFKGALNFLESLRVFVPQIRIVNGSGELKVYVRPNNSLRNTKPVVYDLDGQLLLSPPTELAISEIDRIAVITSSSIGAKYGAPAAGGIIIINTKENY